MEPVDLFSTDRIIFDAELDGLIGAAVAKSSPPVPVQASSPIPSNQIMSTDPRLRKRAAAEPTCLPKRLKVEEGTRNSINMEVQPPSPTFTAQFAPESRSRLPSSERNAQITGNHSLHVHPARRVLLDRPDAQDLRNVFQGSSSSPRWTKTPLKEGRLQHVSSTPTHLAAAEANLSGFPQRSASGHPVTHPRIPAHPSHNDRTWATQRNAVRRQWDTTKDDLEYEALLELRRNEKVANVDRYVPPPGNPHPKRRPAMSRRDGSFPFQRLPEQVQTRIIGFLLVCPQPIRIDFTWLRTFVQGHARVPKATKEVLHEGVRYNVQVQWDKLDGEVTQMQDDMRPFHFALEERAIKTRKTRAPCRGLTTSLLKVSRDVHMQAARVLYGSNTFSFPWATSAWMQLESFLATIGPTNTAYLRTINIHAPLWHLGVHEDFVEGAILDLTSPASRMAVIKPPATDRLLGAIQSSVGHLLQSGNLETLILDLSHTFIPDFTAQSISKTLISTSDAEEYVSRKQKGIELLRQLCEALPNRPALHLRAPTRPEWNGGDATSEKGLLKVMTEAAKYGCGSIEA
ncbi:hypothetical protein LTR85_001890 [Meristemomyces frigidus]|nr:hypothetical protein LTR85_001890 [Meristemomyces frigidus]